MQKDDFIKTQYLSLRDEIKDTKARMFKLVGYGIVVVPSAHFISEKFDLDVILIAIPLLVIVVSLYYVAEVSALMRCGRYIREVVEPEIKDFMGWEEWLEHKDTGNTRCVDKYVSYCFIILFLIYYLGSVHLSVKFIMGKFGQGWGYSAVVIYGLIFICYLWQIILKLPRDTQEKAK